MTNKLNLPEQVPSNFIPLTPKERRAQEAEVIRQEFIKSKGGPVAPPATQPLPTESLQDEQ